MQHLIRSGAVVEKSELVHAVLKARGGVGSVATKRGGGGEWFDLVMAANQI